MLHIQKNDIDLKFNKIAKIIQMQIADIFDTMYFSIILFFCIAILILKLNYFCFDVHNCFKCTIRCNYNIELLIRTSLLFSALRSENKRNYYIIFTTFCHIVTLILLLQCIHALLLQITK